MTMGKWKLCVRWSASRESPSSISLACFKQEESTKLMFISFSNGTGSAFENSLDSGYPFASVLRDVQRQRCWKRGTCSGDGQRLWDYCTARLTDLSRPLSGKVRRSTEPSASPSAAADSEERKICTTCLFAESVGLCLSFLPSCVMYKDNAVGNVVAETGRDLVFMTTARLSDLSMPLNLR